MLKKFLYFFGFVLLIVLGGGFYGYSQLNQLIEKPLNSTTEQFIVIEKGTSSQKLAQQLHSLGIISENEASLLPYIVRLHPEFSRFKAGVYAIENIQNLGELLAHFNSGKEVQLTLQFIEGKTFKVWREQLSKAKFLNQTLADKSETEIATLLGLEHEKLEGWLSPDSYRYVPYSDDLDVLKRAYQKQQKDLEQAWQNRAENLPLKTPYEMLILASIVEKETGVAKERPQVASVFINRLRNGWKLQTDPTVIYGMGERYDGNIRKRDLTEPTAYNTYVIDGLPPTPIAMPSMASLKAVSQPDSTPYFYFVADGTGGHKFSRTLDEHNRAVQEWIQIEKKQKSEKK
ncbi:endolytic transglycosylase MltG [Ursidibacter maritimus]|uniref:endolytic transglycosylase MltG n=1 Tax=Ursidibacter maritimus TaxID=1331689 RepID=UPI001C45C5F3|nr:endolytic transglycosylase MltG [Ursidibacter maritimus]MBV6541032.1 endolytic transglycosylase MltG [Ursidibacter maritimus]